MTSGEHTKGPLKWHRRFSEQDRNGSIYSEPREGHVYAVAMQPQFVTDEQWAHDANLIVTAVNTYPAVAELVKALERAKKLVRLVTVRQAIDSGDDAIEAAGLNPWAMNEGLAEGSERIDAYFIDSALTRFREAHAGGGA